MDKQLDWTFLSTNANRWFDSKLKTAHKTTWRTVGSCLSFKKKKKVYSGCMMYVQCITFCIPWSLSLKTNSSHKVSKWHCVLARNRLSDWVMADVSQPVNHQYGLRMLRAPVGCMGHRCSVNMHEVRLAVKVQEVTLISEIRKYNIYRWFHSFKML